MCQLYTEQGTPQCHLTHADVNVLQQKSSFIRIVPPYADNLKIFSLLIDTAEENNYYNALDSFFNFIYIHVKTLIQFAP